VKIIILFYFEKAKKFLLMSEVSILN